MRRLLRAAMAIVLALVFTTSLLSLSFSALLTPWPTHIFATLFAQEGSYGETHDEMVAVADGILAYCMGNDDGTLPQGTDETTSLTTVDLTHLDDVAVLFHGVLVLAALSTLASIIAAIICRATREKRLLGNALNGAVLLTGGLVVAAVIFALIDFEAFFSFMHHFFFTANSWYFPADSLMIRALPTPFWVAMGVLWSVLLILLCALCAKAGNSLRKHSR